MCIRDSRYSAEEKGSSVIGSYHIRSIMTIVFTVAARITERQTAGANYTVFTFFVGRTDVVTKQGYGMLCMLCPDCFVFVVTIQGFAAILIQ